MRRRHLSIAAFIAVAALPSASWAQHAGHGQHQQHQPYADLTSRAIKALSDEQIADLKAGRGMGLSLPAELNGYPGPRHALELADQMRLTLAQRDTIRRAINEMNAEAIIVGGKIIELERQLEAVFADKTATAEHVRTTVDQTAAAQAELRFVHLKHHLAMRRLLTPDQVVQYATLRGYTPPK